MENISLAADCRVPFLGEAVTVGFGFCTKESPFRLTVLAIGGGGWVGIRLAPKGLVMLEMGLEAGAALSVDLGVASGSVSVMIGVYLRLEDDKGQLTAYFRIRGEVEVLGIASASITLELSLTLRLRLGQAHRPRLPARRDRGAVLLRLGRDHLRTQIRRLQGRPVAGRHHAAGPGRPGHVEPVLLVVRDRSVTMATTRVMTTVLPYSVDPADPFHVSLFFSHRLDGGGTLARLPGDAELGRGAAQRDVPAAHRRQRGADRRAHRC